MELPIPDILSSCLIPDLCLILSHPRSPGRMLCPHPPTTTTTCLLPHKRKRAERLPLPTSCPAPERSPTLPDPPPSAPAGPPRDLRSAAVLPPLPVRASLGAAVPSAPGAQTRATGLPGKAGAGGQGEPEGTQPATRPQLQRSNLHLRHPRSHPGPRVPSRTRAAARGSLALSHTRGGPPPPPSRMEAGLLARRLGWKRIYAACDPNVQREN